MPICISDKEVGLKLKIETYLPKGKKILSYWRQPSRYVDNPPADRLPLREKKNRSINYFPVYEKRKNYFYTGNLIMGYIFSPDAAVRCKRLRYRLPDTLKRQNRRKYEENAVK